MLAILVMAAITLTLRVLPFLLPEDHRILRYFSSNTPTLDALGPSLLGGLTAVTLIPDLTGASSISELAVYAASLIVTLAVLLKTRNIGIAIIIGVFVFAGLQVLFN